MNATPMKSALFAAALALASGAVDAATTFNLAGDAGHDVFYDVRDAAGRSQGTWLHHMIVEKMDLASGRFSGSGYFVANNAYVWGIVSGVVDGSTMTYKIEYTGLDAGYTCDHTGTVSSNTSFAGDCTSSSGQTCKFYTKEKLKPADVDGDGILDPRDACSNTLKGAKTNELGCSMEQLCPCYLWSNHFEYVSCVAEAKKEFVASGILTKEDATRIQAIVGQGDCDRKK